MYVSKFYKTVCTNSYPSLSSLPEFTENGLSEIVTLLCCVFTLKIHKVASPDFKQLDLFIYYFFMHVGATSFFPYKSDFELDPSNFFHLK